jgi:hypothetical protein
MLRVRASVRLISSNEPDNPHPVAGLIDVAVGDRPVEIFPSVLGGLGAVFGIQEICYATDIVSLH